MTILVDQGTDAVMNALAQPVPTDADEFMLSAGFDSPQPLAQWETELLNQQERREIAVAVLGAMDVDQYLIDAVAKARPR